MSYIEKKKKKKKRKLKNIKPLGKLQLGRRPLSLTLPEPSPSKTKRSPINRSQRISPPPSPLMRMYPSSPLPHFGMKPNIKSPEPKPPLKPLKPVDLIWMKDVRISLSEEITNMIVLGDTLCVGLKRGISIWDWRKRQCKKIIKRTGRCYCLAYLPKFWLIFLEYSIGVFLIDIESYKIRAVLDVAVPLYPDFPNHHEKISIPKQLHDDELANEKEENNEEEIDKNKKKVELPDMFLSVDPEFRGIDIFIVPSSPLFIPSKPRVKVHGVEGKLYHMKKYVTLSCPWSGSLRNPIFLPHSLFLVTVTRHNNNVEQKEEKESATNNNNNSNNIKNIIVFFDGRNNFNVSHNLASKQLIRKIRYFYNPRRKMEDLVTISDGGLCTIWNLKDRVIERHVQVIRDIVSLPYMRNSYIMSYYSSISSFSNFYIHLQTEKRGRKRKHHLQIWEFINENNNNTSTPKKTKKKKVKRTTRIRRWGKKKTDNNVTRHTDIFWLDESKCLMGVIFEKRLSIFKLTDRRLSDEQLEKVREREISSREDLFTLQQLRPKFEEKGYQRRSNREEENSFNFFHMNNYDDDNNNENFNILKYGQQEEEEEEEGIITTTSDKSLLTSQTTPSFDSFFSTSLSSSSKKSNKVRTSNRKRLSLQQQKKKKKKKNIKKKKSIIDVDENNYKTETKFCFTKEEEIFRVQFVHRHLNDILVFKSFLL